MPKKLKGNRGPFGEKKNLTMPKKLKGGPLGIFNIHSVAKHQKIEGGPFGEIFFRKKVSHCRKKLKGLFSLSRYGILRGKRGKTILVQFARPNDSIWHHKIL